MGPSVEGMLTFCSNCSASLNKMVAMPIHVYGKNTLTFDFFMIWSYLCPSCGNTGRLLHGICKYAGERILAHGPLVCIVIAFN